MKELLLDDDVVLKSFLMFAIECDVDKDIAIVDTNLVDIRLVGVRGGHLGGILSRK